jgi:hypothetical protein
LYYRRDSFDHVAFREVCSDRVGVTDAAFLVMEVTANVISSDDFLSVLQCIVDSMRDKRGPALKASHEPRQKVDAV